MISNDCLRIKTDSKIFSAPSTSSSFVDAGATTGWLSVDSSLTYVLQASAILKFSSGNTSYDSVYTFSNLTFSAGSMIQTYSNRIVVYSTTASTANLNVFIDNSGTLTELLALAPTGFDSAPQVKTSSQLTKVLIYGLVSAAAKTYFYFVDYTTSSNRVITFPTVAIFDPAAIGLILEDSWLYVRQLASGSQTIAGGNLEYIFAILLNTIT
jgi:hypothetical protein